VLPSRRKSWRQRGVSTRGELATLCRAFYRNVFSHVPASRVREVSHIKRTVEPADSDLPVAIDIELFPGQEKSNINSLAVEAKCALDAGNGAIRENVSALVKMIEDTYRKLPIIYGNDFVLDTVLTPAVTSKASIWRVKYGLADNASPPPWTLWRCGHIRNGRHQCAKLVKPQH
jgi:GH25 family lysozyme M1 (1,4-beta-N-acetylmuramidase)